jgi:hypothetical protein
MASDVSGGGSKLRREKSTDGPLHRRPSSPSSAPECDTQQPNQGDDQDEVAYQQDTGASYCGQVGLTSRGMSFPFLSLLIRRNTAIKMVSLQSQAL